MTAGEPAAALLELRDGVGRRALHGGVQVEATLVPSADAAGRSGPAAAGVRAAAGPGAQRGAATGTGAQRDNPAGTAGRASGPSACKASAAARDEPGAVPEVAVVDRGNGLYELRFTLTRAGAWALVARLATGSGGGGGGGGGGGDDDCGGEGGGAEARCAVTCTPGAASPAHFTADAAALGSGDPGRPWRAGEPGALTVVRRDRYGNRLAADERGTGLPGPAPAPPLRARLTGAGAASAAAAEAGGGAVVVTCAAHVAGAYALDLRCGASGDFIAGSPFQARTLRHKT